jgi:hypothetical protein
MRRRRHIGRHSWVLGLALSLCGAHVGAAQSSTAGSATLLIDRDISPAAGATATITVGRLVAHAEDRFVPLRLFADHGRLRRATNASYRLAKLALFDAPQENWLRVANHELFGHGGRLRELFNGPVSYALPAPPPYGRGGGATYFQLDRAPTVEETLAVTVGGMEANRMMARFLTQDALTSGHWHYRDARRYLYAEYDTIRYIRRTTGSEKEGHDVRDFLKVYNEVATAYDAKTLSARTLRRRVLAGFANPMIAYSYYSAFISYVWSGHADSRVPMLRLGATRYLPMARFQLTSFGTEWVIDNVLVRNGRFIDATIRAGQTIGARTWGVGLQTTRLAAWKGWTFDGDGDLWHQPEWGGEVTATAHRQVRQLPRLHNTLAFVVQAGYKTNGFLAGDRIYQGGVLRIGASLVKP